MMKLKLRTFWLLTFASGYLLCSCGIVQEEPIEDVSPLVDLSLNSQSTKVKSSYIRHNFYQNESRITEESMLAYNDLIMIAFRPYTDGSIYFDLPDNRAGFTNVDYLQAYKNRTGVMDFKGENALMNAGADLLHQVRSYQSDGSYKQFTFGSWLYIDQWIPGAYLFRKENSNGYMHCMMGDTQGELIFDINGKTASVVATDLNDGSWHHVALAYHGDKSLSQRVAFYIDGTSLNYVTISPDFPTQIPFVRTLFYVGVDMDAKMDETFIHSLYLSDSEVSSYKDNGIALRNTDWNSTKTLAYWTYDEPLNPGKDYQSWRSIADEVRSKIQGTGTKLRLGMTGGDWKTIIRNSTYRTNFVNSVYNHLLNNEWDGIDLDFEWCTTAQEYSDYSTTIIELSNKLAPLDVTLSVSLHPVSHQISQAAIDATDFISLQVYGPSPWLFPYAEFVNQANIAVNYGIPKNKLVLGVPLYGVASDGSKTTHAYVSFDQAGLINTPDIDQVYFDGKDYTFNGQTTIGNKANFIQDNQYLGIMTWDLATDVPVTNNKSLTKTINEVFETP